jgi:cell division septation protein DedD
VFVSLLAFSLGIYVGKNLSDKDYDRIALSSKEYSKDKFQAPVSEEEGDDEVTSNQEQIEALAEEAMKNVRSGTEGEEPARALASTHEGADAHAAPAHDAHASTAPMKDAHAAPSAHAVETPTHGVPKAASRVANDLSPSENVKPVVSNKPGALPTGVGEARVEYTVQIASYPTAEEAAKHTADLVKKGFPAFHVPATLNGKVWHRVSVGTFKEKDAAKKYREQFATQTGVNGLIQKITR